MADQFDNDPASERTIVKTARQARQAERGPTMRIVLMASLGLVVAAFVIVGVRFFAS